MKKQALKVSVPMAKDWNMEGIVLNQLGLLKRVICVDRFDNPPISTKRVDLIYFNGFSSDTELEPLGGIGTYSSLTYVHDLSRYSDRDALYSEMNKDCRNSINRSIKDNVTYTYFGPTEISKALVDDFLSVLKRMYETKHLKFSVNKKLIWDFVKSQSLAISTTSCLNETLCYHVYQLGHKRVVLWFSCSNFRLDKDKSPLIGRANRYQHFMDLCNFKSLDISTYDWGGISSSNPNDPIARFKLSFKGGEVGKVYSTIVPCSVFGRIILCAKRLREKPFFLRR